MIALQADCVGRPTRRYVDVTDTTRIVRARTSGMTNCKRANWTYVEIVDFSTTLTSYRIEPMIKILSAGWEK